ncbi:MAG: M20/M25/M40 family metallo-hydrolase [Azospirillaceae bacterium]
MTEFAVDGPKRALLEAIDRDREAIIKFVSEFVRCRTPNPPGVTTEAADFVRSFLEQEGLACREIAPQADRPNFVATLDLGPGDKHLVLNGHIDVFPVEDEARWTVDPWGGEVRDGRINGRGAADMKCGTAASIWTYRYLSGVAEQLCGRLTLTVVSEEENFGPDGMRHLMDRYTDDVLGTCCLNGEPSSPHTVRFGEKAPLWLKFFVKTRGGHGAFVHTSDNAGLVALDIISELRQIPEMPFQEPAALAAVLDQSSEAIDRAYGDGASRVIRQPSFNLGTIRAGVKVNMIAAECEFEADFRIPNGITSGDVLQRVDAIMERFPQAQYEVLNRNEPNWCEPDHEMIRHVQENAALLGREPPARVISPGATDARLWRLRGVPAVVYGPTPNGMGSADEYVEIDELMHVVKCHVLSAFDYLRR